MLYVSRICNAVNYPAYRRGPTLQGTTACRKRVFERILPEIQLTMDRLTNPFKLMTGSEVPNMQSICNYVVLQLQRCMKQSVASSGLISGSPKVSIRRSQLELGISRNMEIWGRRRIHSTAFICRKGSSLVSPFEPKLAGFENNGELNTLKYNLEKENSSDNFSRIMSNPEFLMACWAKIRSHPGGMTPAFGNTLDGLNKTWFADIAKGMRNGRFQFSLDRRKYVTKPNGKLRPITIPSPRDKIVQEGMRFLLEMAFERTFSDHSYGFRPGLGCHAALKSLKKSCKAISWYIEGDIEQQFPTINHEILVELLKIKIKDQAFIDLIYKYIRNPYGETPQNIFPMKIGIIQGGNLSPILSNIYMTPFDEWIEKELIANFIKGEKRQVNPVYTRAHRAKVKDWTLRSKLANDPSFKRAYYFRYVDDFIIGVDGSKADCVEIREKVHDFLRDTLKLSLNIDKTKITHAEESSAKFLGFSIHKTKIEKMKIARDKNNHLMRRVPRPMLDAPINNVVKKLEEKGYAKNGQPKRNARFINHQLADIINHYKSVERGIINYYSIASNYGRLVARVHYILKYSCVLTIASKMNLSTKKRVFRKYGKNLSVKDGIGKTIYPTPSYAKPKKSLTIERYQGDFIDKLTSRLDRGRRDLEGVCTVCGSSNDIEIHHVRALRKTNALIRKDFLSRMMSNMNRKQIPLCKECHIRVHKGVYYGSKIA